MNVLQNAANTVIPLSNSFASSFEASSSLTYAITSDSDSALFSSTPISTTNNVTNLTLAYASNVTGTSMLTIQATDSLGQSVSTNFTVTVTATGAIVSGKTLTITGAVNDNVAIAFSDANDFTVTIDGGTPTAYNLSNINKLVYNGPTGAVSEVVFADPVSGDTYAGTQTLTATSLVRNGFEFDANNVSTLYSYSNGTSTANVTVNGGSGNNFFVGVMGTGTNTYSYIADPIAHIFSELGGFVTENVSGTGGTTYGYVYSTSHATIVGDPSSSTFALNGNTSTLSDFPEVYIVAPPTAPTPSRCTRTAERSSSSPGFGYVSGTANGSNFLIGALYTATLTAQASSTSDSAIFYSYAHNTFNGASGASSLSGSTTNVGGSTVNFVVQATGYSAVSVFESGSNTDVANLTSPGGGSFFGTSTAETLTMGTSSITVNTYFSSNGQLDPVPAQVAVTGGGSDTADIYDSPGANALTGSGSTATLATSYDTITINNFASVTANQQNGTTDTVHKGAIDFTLSTVGNWTSD